MDEDPPPDPSDDLQCPVCRAQKREIRWVRCGWCATDFDYDAERRVCPKCGCWYGATVV